MPGSVPLNEDVHFDVITAGNTGAAADADSPPTFSVYEEATDVAILGPVTFTKRTALTGNYRGTFSVTVANGFEVGKWYNVISTATVGGITGKCVCLAFRCAPAENVVGVPIVDTTTLSGTASTAITTLDALIDRIAPTLIGTLTGAGSGIEVYTYAGVTVTAHIDIDGNRSFVGFS